MNAYQDASHGAGVVLRKRQLPGFEITEESYETFTKTSQHRHSNAHLTFVLDGSYVERYSGAGIVYGPGSLRFLPARELHDNEFQGGLRWLQVRVEEPILERVREHSAALERPLEVTGRASTWLANRLYVEFCRKDNISPVAMEGVILEMLVEGARAIETSPQGSTPRWLQRAREIVETRFLEPLSLAQIASSVGVHHVHLSREFRRHHRCTVGELIRRKRVEHACHLLAHSEMMLAEIALVCGFSDQSHFSLMFKRHMGLTPSKFRDLSAAK